MLKVGAERGSMSEELQTKDLELKELFIKQEYDSLIEELDQMIDLDIVEMTQINHSIVKKYYDLGRSDLMRQHLSFVAYASFLTEYAGKRKLFVEQDYQEKFDLFQEIYQLLHEE